MARLSSAPARVSRPIWRQREVIPGLVARGPALAGVLAFIGAWSAPWTHGGRVSELFLCLAHGGVASSGASSSSTGGSSRRCGPAPAGYSSVS